MDASTTWLLGLMTTRDWAFARRPVWLVGHLVAALAVVVFVAAGSWQLDRHEQRQALDVELEERLAAPAMPLDTLRDRPPEQIRYRLATATGVFDRSDEVILLLQTRRGVSGHHVLTPLVTSPGRAVLVDRGWVPFELDEPGDDRFAPPPGEVTVTGHVLTTQTRGRSVPPDGVLAQIGRVDLDRLNAQMDLELEPVYLQLAEPLGQADELPSSVTLDALEPAPPHLSYAVQWFVFATVVVVGYAILMYRTSRAEVDDVSAAG